MWKNTDLRMQELNTTGNSTCLNDTCLDVTIEPTHLKWGLLLLILVIVCTAAGNLLVCLAVCSDRRLQNMTNYFLMSLAIADFLVSIVVMPFGMIVGIYGHFPLEAEYCAFWVTMDVLMCTASIWHMCTMSMDRYFTLKYPMQYGRNKTRTMVAIKIIFVWAVSITISSPICIYGLVDESSVFINQQCIITLRHFIIYGSVFAFYIPLCIMILTYLLTIKILWQNQNLMRTIERSDFRMRPRHSIARPCHIRTMVSPPSSDSKRDSHSHTELSSLARTPIREKVNLPCDPSDRRYIEMKEIIDNAYIQSLCSNIPNSNNETQLSQDIPQKDKDLHETQNDSSIDVSNDNLGENDKDDNDMDSEEEEEHCNAKYMKLCVPNSTAVTHVHVQSPSEDEDVDETSTLLSMSSTKLSRSNNNSPKLSRFRVRANTDLATSSGPYPASHSSLKIPKSFDKQNLQTSVSCSNFSQKRGYNQDCNVNTGPHGGGLANRDYKSLEWCQHFYEIQEEMDQCLREARQERKHLRQVDLFQSQNADLRNTEFHSTNSCRTEDSGIPPSVKKDELKPELQGDVSESGDSMEDVDSSSDNTSDLLTIKLYPKSVYMYKLDVPSKSSPRNSNLKPNGNLVEKTQNGSIAQYARQSREDSIDSDKSLENLHKVHKRNSIKKFIKHCKRKNGFKHLVSSKTTTNEKKASKVLGIIFVVFVVLWTPFFCVNIILAICDSCEDYVSPDTMSVFVWMGYIASLANPIIYTMFNTAFRRAFTRILACKMCQKQHRRIHRSSVPSLAASVYNDRRQTISILLNGHHDRVHSDLGSTSIGKSPVSN